MKKKLCSALALTLALSMLGACSAPAADPTAPATSAPEVSQEPQGPVVESFSAEYEMTGTTSAGKPKNDTFIFEGTTEDGIIKTLNFDIIRNKGLDDEYSKKGIMGYMMNVSDAEVVKTGSGWSMPALNVYGYETQYDFGQYMVYGVLEELTEDSTFADMTITSYTGDVLDMDKAITVYRYFANEGGIELTAETPVKDLLAIQGLYKDGTFQEGKNRVSFAGYHGGRSYGEQMEAIEEHILTHDMTLEDVYEMFQTVNQQSEPIEERDTVSGATIAFVGDFQRMVYLAIHGELFEGVATTSQQEEGIRYEVVTQGYGGEVETYVTINGEGKVVSISVRDSQETPEVGGKLTEENSEFIQALVAGQEDVSKVDAIAGATFTSNALIKAVQFAQEASKN